ncbi:MAG: FHA domain-containing protein [Myxococcales bacterium]|nr:FHA domain-containing protein [Myxococcales bacterium]
MGFQLVIAEGKEAGKEFVFDQSSVVIGRTSECDVVLYDPGVSRKHARIFSEGERYFVEDMGSSNGTKVNGSIVKKKELSDGDAVALGPVVFNFSALEVEEPTGSNPVANQDTRIVAASDVKRPKNKPVALAPEGVEASQLSELARRSTRTMQAVSRPRSGPTNAVARPAPAAAAAPKVQLTAADRARIKRESGALMASLRIFWAEASQLTRKLVLGALGALGLGLLAFLYYLVAAPSDDRPAPPPEPQILTRKPIEESFGLGDGVVYHRPDMKILEFEYNAPVKAVVILHFQSKEIAQGEVMVSVNGADVGALPPDTLAVNERSNEIIIPPANLKKGERNKVIFDNTKNPPHSEPWRIWNVWVEINLLPELPLDELLRNAQMTFERAVVTFERRDVGAGNRYEAWKDFRTTWLMLEAYPEPKPELYILARDKVKEAQQELDRKCAQLMLEAEGGYNQKQFEAARATLEHVHEYFPANDQPCPWRAEQKRAEYGL